LDYLIEQRFVSETIAGFTLVDARLLPDKTLNNMDNITRAALLTVPYTLYCGSEEVESLALQQAIQRSIVNPEDEDEFLAEYRAEAGTRMSRVELIGPGMMRFGVFNGTNLMGSATIARISVLARVGNEIQVRATGTLFRRNVRVFNDTFTRLTAQFITDQANLFRGLLNATFRAVDSPITAKVMVIDPHMKNDRYEALQATVLYDAALATAMGAFPEIVATDAQEGARTYKVYSHV